MMGWQWHQLDHTQIICISLQTDNHASTLPLSFFTGRPFLPPNQQRQSTEGITLAKSTRNEIPEYEHATVEVTLTKNRRKLSTSQIPLR